MELYHWGPVKCGLHRQVVLRGGLTVLSHGSSCLLKTAFTALTFIGCAGGSVPLADVPGPHVTVSHSPASAGSLADTMDTADPELKSKSLHSSHGNGKKIGVAIIR